jgi:hypothetical protein
MLPSYSSQCSALLQIEEGKLKEKDFDVLVEACKDLVKQCEDKILETKNQLAEMARTHQLGCQAEGDLDQLPRDLWYQRGNYDHPLAQPPLSASTRPEKHHFPRGYRCMADTQRFAKGYSSLACRMDPGR